MWSVSRSIAVIMLLGGMGVSEAAEQPVQFSADIIQTAPQRPEQKGRMYVGKEQVRTEFEMNDQQFVQIIDTAKQRSIVLFPEKHTYMQRSAGPGQPGPQAGMGSGDGNPCAGMPNITCKLLGKEDINGRTAEKWEISGADQQGGEQKMVVWVDAEHRFPVRQIWPDGSTMELRFMGIDTVNGRKAEKWEMTVTREGGTGMTETYWYDPELKTNIREERQGGYVKELTNIKVGTQPEDLFQVPPGYTEMTQPQQQGQGGPQ
jgi:hypothetical protein